VQLLLGKETNVAAKDKDGGTVLHFAAQNRHEAVVRLLLENSADVAVKNKVGTAIQVATERGHEIVVQLLLENRANVVAKKKGGWTALYWAATQGYETAVRLLLEKGKGGGTVLHLVA